MKPPSRQLRWQWKKKAQGLCRICGRPAVTPSGLCQEHLEDIRVLNRVLRGCKPWKPGGPGRPPFKSL